MIYCNNMACDYGDEPLQRISDYKVTSLDDGTQVVLCVGCYEDEMYHREEDAAHYGWSNSETPDQYEAQAVLRGEG